MNRAYFYFISILTLIFGWVLALTDNNNFLVQEAGLFNKTGLPAIKGPMEVEPQKSTQQPIESVANKPVNFEKEIKVVDEPIPQTQEKSPQVKRISKIKSLVNKSIEEDNSSLNHMEKREEQLEKEMAAIMKNRTEVMGRLVKLQKLSVILEAKRDQEKTDQNLTITGSTNRNHTFIHHHMKTILGRRNLFIEDFGKTTKLDYNASQLVIRDHKPRRISQVEGDKLVSALEQFKGNSDIETVVLLRDTNTPISEVSLIRDYLNRQFGWSTKVVNSTAQDSVFPINLKIIAKNKGQAQ